MTSMSRVEYWWKNVVEKEDLTMDGIAIAPKPPSNYFECAKMLLYLIEKGITKNVHILGVSGGTVTPVITYLSKYIKKLTYDSASYAQGRINSNFIVPGGSNYHIISKDK